MLDKIRTAFYRLQAKLKGKISVDAWILIIAITLGLFSGLIYKYHNEAFVRDINERYQFVEVLAVSKDIPQGNVLSRDHIESKNILLTNLTANMVREKDIDLILGKRVAIELKKHDILNLTSVLGAERSLFMADAIPPGKRLFTLNISDSNASKGFIKPNDHVDVLAHIDLPNRGMTTFKVLEDVTVISIGNSNILNSNANTHGSDVSFFIDDRDAEIMAFAGQRGKFSLSLRNPKDMKKSGRSVGVSLKEFLDHEEIQEASGGTALDVTVEGKATK